MIKTNRIIKRKKLIRKLIKGIVNKYSSNIRIRIIDRDCKQINELNSTSYADHYANNTRHTIGINLLSLRRRIIKGYNNSYYSGRHNKLSFVIGNKRLALRFVIYHELGHCLLREQGNNSEVNADNFAIDKLKQEGFLND
jgi:Zn-dependent peptidase ImmA (M78 family)